MSLSMEASFNGCERYLLICYQQIYKATYLCQSLLELGPSSIGLKLGCYSYKGNYYGKFTLSTYVIQASVMEKWGYEIHTKRRWMEIIKQLDSYLVTSISHIKSCHVCSWP